MSHTQEHNPNKEDHKSEHIHENQNEGSFNTTVKEAEKKQKNWFQRWGNRIKKGFDYVHERSVAFNERGFDGHDVIDWSKKLEAGGFGDGTKMYDFFKERKWESKKGFREEMKNQGLQYQAERKDLALKTEQAAGRKNEAQVNELLKQALVVGQKMNVMGEDFIVTSMYEKGLAKNTRDSGILMRKLAKFTGHGHADHPARLMKIFNDFSSFAPANGGGGREDHERDRDHH